MGSGDHEVGHWWTKVIGQLNSCKTLIMIYSTMLLMHLNQVIPTIIYHHWTMISIYTSYANIRWYCVSFPRTALQDSELFEFCLAQLKANLTSNDKTQVARGDQLEYSLILMDLFHQMMRETHLFNKKLVMLTRNGGQLLLGLATTVVNCVPPPMSSDSEVSVFVFVCVCVCVCVRERERVCVCVCVH